MKKIIISTVLAAMLPVSSVFAAVSFDTKTDFTNGTVCVSGKSEANKDVTIQVFKDGKSLEDFEGNEAGAYAYSVFVNQQKTDADGNFSFDFKYSGSSGTLNGYLTEADTAPEQFEIMFINAFEYKDNIADLNDFADAENKVEFIARCNAIAPMLGADMEIYDSIDKEKAAGMFYDSVKKNKLNSEDSKKVSERFNASVAAQALNEKKLTSVSTVLKADLPTDLLEEIEKFTSGAEAEKYFIYLSEKKQILDLEGFEKVMKESLILTVAKYPQGFANLQSICEKYASFIGISQKYGAEAYKTVAGNDVSGLAELVLKLAAANNSGRDTGKSSGGKNTSSVAPIVSGGSQSGQTISDVKMPFVDMSSVGWAYTAVSTLADRGIISGKSETQFYPNDYITREEFVKIIILASGAQITQDNTAKFADVDLGKWYAPYVNTAYRLNVCNGISENMFGVGMNIKRQDAAVMVYNILSKKGAFETEKTDFNDYEEISDYAKEAVSRLAGAAIIKGSDNSFRPYAFLTRAEAAQIIYGSLDKF